MEYAICILTIRPNKNVVQFYNMFTNYDVFFIIDDIHYDCSAFKTMYPSIQFIQISNEECDYHGYKHSSHMPRSSLDFNPIVAWDRALYYFCNVNTKYNHIWFLEEDVFIYGEETILNIDTNNTYILSDLLCRDKTPKSKKGEWQWFWPAIFIPFEEPYFQSMICVTRMSRKLLNHIAQYIEIHKKLFFVEAMFPTIAHKHNLIYNTPSEFQNILWRYDWQLTELTKYDFFHPLKNPDKHQQLRKNMIIPNL